jgi:cytoskeletal protein CcmA (bactofilin family)
MPLRSIASPRSIAVLAVAVVCALAGGATLVAEVGRRTGETVTVAAGEVVPDDLYATGEVVRVEGTVRGDLVAVAREVIVAGTVEGDVIAAAQAVSITGTVGDDARVAGQVILLSDTARLADDLVAAGFSLEAEAGSSIGGSVLFAGYQALLAGEVTESLRMAVGALALAGTVHGDVEAKVGAADERTPPQFGPPPPVRIPTVASGLGLADGARVGGDLRYESPDEAEIAPGAEIAGEVVYEPVAGEQAPTAGDRVLGAVRRLVALLLVGGLLVLLAPRWLGELAATVRQRPLPSLGWGLVFLVAAIFAALLLALAVALVAALLGLVTLKGLAIAIAGLGILAELALVFGLIVVCAYLPAVVVGLAGGRLAVARDAQPTRVRLFAALALGVTGLVVLGLVPYLGALVGLLVALLGLGALWLWGAGRLRDAPPAPA